MYQIIGADNRPYGPITADQVKQWIAEARAGSETRAQVEGSADWKPLSAFPEFAEAIAAQVASNPRPPFPLTMASSVPPPRQPGEAMVAQILARDYTLEASSCVGRAWTLVTQNFWLLVGATFVAALVGGVVPLVLIGPSYGGIYALMLKLIRGEKAEFSDAFAGFNAAFLPLLLVGLVTALLSAVGFVACILPGIFLSVAWLMAIPLVIDKKLEFWDAMETSRKVICQHWWQWFGLVLLNFLVILVGHAACFVGVLVAMPVAFGAMAYAYEDTFGKQTAQLIDRSK